jgi:predicted NBD/HSP70 family sugar kinase
LSRDGLGLARSGTSALLAQALADDCEITAETVIWAAQHGEPAARDLVATSARLLGESLARVVNFFNPSLILIGGGVASAGDFYLAEIRQSVIARSLPLATRSLHIARSPLADRAGLRGAAFMVVDELLSPERLAAADVAVG